MNWSLKYGVRTVRSTAVNFEGYYDCSISRLQFAITQFAIEKHDRKTRSNRKQKLYPFALAYQPSVGARSRLNKLPI